MFVGRLKWIKMDDIYFNYIYFNYSHTKSLINHLHVHILYKVLVFFFPMSLVIFPPYDVSIPSVPSWNES